MAATQANAASAIWTSAIRFDQSKINWPIAIRNSLGVALPLLIGPIFGEPLAGVAVAIGALNVSYSDGDDAYSLRAKRMLLWGAVGALAVFFGAIAGWSNIPSVLLSAAWAFAAGMMLSLGTRAGDLGVNSLVILVVFGARSLSLVTAGNAALLSFGGALLQLGLSVLLWPVRRHVPERRMLKKLYEDLAELTQAPKVDAAKGPQDTGLLQSLARDHSVEAERYRLLFDQAERIRLSLFILDRLRKPSNCRECLDRARALTGRIVLSVSKSFMADTSLAEADQALIELKLLLKEIDGPEFQQKFEIEPHVAADTQSEIDALAGRLRAIVGLARNATPEGSAAFERVESSLPLKLQLANRLGTIRANINLQSAVYRHAIRLAVCLAIGDAIGRSIDWRRSYWIPMTIAVVLKPDFTTTFSRGALRLAGTFSGLILATLLFHFFPIATASEMFLIGLFTFLLRSVGAANYGIFSGSVGALVVLLIALTGVSPKEVIVARALNTAAGGLLALAAYAAWPTWERTQVSESLAQMLDSYLEYFRAVIRLIEPGEQSDLDLDKARLECRRTRSNTEASIDRLGAEPKTTPDLVSLLNSMLASSHHFLHAVVALEAGFSRGHPPRALPALQSFAHDSEFTLYYLSAALRGSGFASQNLPKLRADHSRLLKEDADLPESLQFLLIETDRVTNSLNTLTEQISRYLVADHHA